LQDAEGHGLLGPDLTVLINEADREIALGAALGLHVFEFHHGPAAFDAAKDPEVITPARLHMDAVLCQAAQAAGVGHAVAVLALERLHAVGQLGRHGAGQLPIHFLIAAVPEGGVLIVHGLLETQPLPCGEGVGRDGTESPVINHLRPEAVHLAAESGFDELSQDHPFHGSYGGVGGWR